MECVAVVSVCAVVTMSLLLCYILHQEEDVTVLMIPLVCVVEQPHPNPVLVVITVQHPKRRYHVALVIIVAPEVLSLIHVRLVHNCNFNKIMMSKARAC